MGTAWLVLAGTQPIRNIGDLSRFGGTVFQLLAPLQLAILTFLAALGASASISQEKDRRTLTLLLLTRMSNSELVLGKLAASLLNVLSMLLAAVPVFLLITVFGGVSLQQVGTAYAVTAASILAAAATGCMVAFWRDKTFQSLAITVLAIVLWIGIWEALAVGSANSTGPLHMVNVVAETLSPLRAVFFVVVPDVRAPLWWQMGAWNYVCGITAVTILIVATAIWRVRIWNPSKQLHRRVTENQDEETIWEVDRNDTKVAAEAEAARQSHVDARLGKIPGRKSRHVWDHPILWREVCTWAYGRKVLFVRLAYLLLFALTLIGLQWAQSSSVFEGGERRLSDMIPLATRILAPFTLISLVIVNALAVTSITNERDEQALDLLLVTDITPREFVFGKLLGVLWITKEMVLAPIISVMALCWFGGISLENAVYVLLGLSVMNLFVAMLGIHYGMSYSSSRNSILVSLGTVFFLFVGVVTCMVIMISFRSSFQNQLAPFLAFILGGGVGLYVTLGHRNPSPAIAASSLVLPFATFFAITGFLLQNQELTVFVVIASAYGFTISAMMVPAISEFDIAMGRSQGGEDV